MSESTRRVHGKGATGTQELDVLIIGGGQSGLATAYYVRKATDNYLVLDNQERPGGAWLHAWDSMTLFSASSFSNLPGYPMPSTPGYPSRDHVIDYLTEYERRYALPVVCPVEVTDIAYSHARFTVNNRWSARELIGATGTWSSPFVPHYPGTFRGTQWHSGTYPGPEPFAGTSVAVVGGGNSAAQIAAELSSCTEVTWYTRRPPRFIPDDVDGLELFHNNRKRMLAILRGEKDPGPDRELGDIVMLPAIRAARDSGRLVAHPMFDSLDNVTADHLIWCTGFRPALGPLRGHLHNPHLHLVGYGDIVGPGAATITGVAPYAKAAAKKATQNL
ncbi:NAD(P)-binding domain-containing protein [Corynebacterium pyruviciproducens]|uniref:NAD(P)-binding domain-containing protein n=1 Tax=Corynebacterium pyruviciproducens TaxID=598660 RepID=UPI002550911A|nr:NAD(P)-binding domain-containing protein [Corynebacterium pyruviciproducens]MDK6565504.1 NAD(P)-binding domain-containing protein [Corynebacterium pyruviciproducens]